MTGRARPAIIRATKGDTEDERPPDPARRAAPSDPARQIESPIEAALDRLARVLNMWEATTGEPLSHSEIDAARAELAKMRTVIKLRDALDGLARE